LATLERSARQDEIALDELDEPHWGVRWEAAAVPIFADEADGDDEEYERDVDADADADAEPDAHERRFHE
jgi:hypothetical protein